MANRDIASGLCAVALAMAAAAPVHAGDNDLVLSRLGTIVSNPDGVPVDVVGSNLEFRSLASELGVVFAPRLLAPSDTLGFGGFQFTVDLALTGIDSDASYWRALEGSPNAPSAEHGEPLQQTLGFFVRKGLWLPLPSFEIGAGAVHLLESDMWAAQGYAKFALHEGFHDLPLPSAAVRGAASRVMGSNQIDLSIASLDLSISKDFGFQGTMTVSPYAGWNVLWIIPRSEVIDKTPHIDVASNPMDVNMSFVFRDQDNITRQRVFGGLKLHYYVFALTLEAVFALPGSSVDDRPGTDLDCASVDPAAPTASCDAEDQAAAQATYTASFGFDF